MSVAARRGLQAEARHARPIRLCSAHAHDAPPALRSCRAAGHLAPARAPAGFARGRTGARDPSHTAPAHDGQLLDESDPLCVAASKGHVHYLEALLEQGASANRSEEHTSELQSLMRNSYALICLKTTKRQYTSNEYNPTT